MRSTLVQQLIAGMLGATIGALTEEALRHAFGGAIITDGAFWGALLAVAVASLPNLRGMGARVLRHGTPWQQMAVGIIVFAIISAGVVLVFFLIFSFWLRLLT